MSTTTPTEGVELPGPKASTCTLLKLAPEVRIMIFELTVIWEGKTPNVIKALRGEAVLYEEVLAVLSRNCTFSLSYRNNWMEEKWSPYMSVKAIQSVRKLDVELECR